MPIIITPKFWCRSRTILFNAACVLLSLVALVADNVQLLTPALSPRAMAWVLFAVAIINMGLRKITKQPLSMTKPEGTP